MRYYINTNAGAIRNDFGQLILFSSYSDARHWAINHLDLSMQGLSIEDIYNQNIAGPSI